MALRPARLEGPAGQIIMAHDELECGLDPTCSVHHRSDHSMRHFPQHWRDDRYMMERICGHGIGHPDPDHLAFIQRRFGDDARIVDSIHGCDGCCS